MTEKNSKKIASIFRNIESGVEVWEQPIVIPTYPVGFPDKNPMFLENRVYQGSSGKVYPHSVIDKIYDEKIEKTYQAICIENKYLFVMILPELGGRIQRAYDKTNGYDFVYYNQVIKPALVGLTGPWISGGIEFNWPQHHRPSTFDPDNAYIQIDVRLYNRTDVPQTFLWWANPAISVNDFAQSVFPPDVNAVMDHGKRAVSKFPIATGTYYKYDYSAGVDISRYKNIPVPTSYMAYHSDYDFIGGYDHQKKAGIYHVADHHISPGKKQWTWGCGDFGKAWDRNLTDEDGPYIELMTGCFTDNQPDFTWLLPFEEKTFTQYFMPYKEVGMIKNATVKAAVGLELTNEKITASVYATTSIPNAKITVLARGIVVLEESTSLSPVHVFRKEFAAAPDLTEADLSISVFDENGNLIITYQGQKNELVKYPDPAEEVPLPAEIRTNEELFLAGLHLEQYRHATYLPEDYYLEGLNRDPSDARINTAYGSLLLRRGKFTEAEAYFKQAIAKLTRRNPNPYDGEPYYNLGLCQKLEGNLDQAYAAFYKATWSGAWQDSGFYQMACILSAQGKFIEALDFADRSLVRNAHSMKTRLLKTALLRHLGRKEQALDFVRETRQIDPMDFSAVYESVLLTGDSAEKVDLFSRLVENPNWSIEVSLEYSTAGLYAEANAILQHYAESRKPLDVYPMVYYHLGANYERMGQKENAASFYVLAAEACSDYCFPHRLEDILVLQMALRVKPDDAKGWYYLGNIWYDKRQYAEAISCWERSRDNDANFPTVHRNLSLAYYNKLNQPAMAFASLEEAYRLDEQDARVLMELDQLRKKVGVDQVTRLGELEKHFTVTEKRDDLYLEYVSLQNGLGNYEKGLSLLVSRNFHPWEGGEGKAPRQYILSLTELAKQALTEGDAQKAGLLLTRALTYPENFGEGKLAGAQENNIYYYLGLAYERLGEFEKSKAAWLNASQGLDEPAGMMYYYDQPPEMIFYQGLALKKLGLPDQALSRFNKLINYGEKHIFDSVKIEYFAVSLPDLLIFDEDLDRKNRVHCLFMMGLGALGKNDPEFANRHFMEAAALDSSHIGVRIHQNLEVW